MGMSALHHTGYDPARVIPLAPAARAPSAEAVLGRVATTIRAAKHEAICHDGDEADAYFRVETGCLRVSKTLSDGRRHVVDFLFAGGFFGLTQGDTCDCTVEALTDTVLTRFPRRQLEAIAERDPATCNMLRRAVNAALSAAQVRSMLLARLSAEERLAAFLLDLAGRTGATRRLPLPMTRVDIGDYLGLTIETVSRTFTKFRTRGWIHLGASQDVTLVALDRLGELSEGGVLQAA